jgi:glucose uptake protein
MVIINNYSLAVFLCFITMLCWGSWANTLKLAKKDWAYPLYYWDYSIGVVLLALIFGLTMGNTGESGQSFFANLKTASLPNMGNAFLGGVVFNLGNLLIVAATAVAGMSVAFPIAVGLALVIGVLDNYIRISEGNPLILFSGVGLVILAIVINAIAYRKKDSSKEKSSGKGIILSILSGSIMGFFFGFVAKTLPADFSVVSPGDLTPYTAVFIFTLGIFFSNFIFNSWFMYRPVSGEKVTYKQYFREGNFRLHLIGILGGIIWNIGMSFSILASDTAGPAISYGLGQGATMVAAAWGVFVWKEFKGAPKAINWMLTGMFFFFILGLVLIIVARTL